MSTKFSREFLCFIGSLCLGGAAWGELPELDVTSYVSGGLVFHYDGIRNAGSDAAHDPAATTWKNLASGASDAELPAGKFAINAKSIVLTNATAIATDAVCARNSKTITLEGFVQATAAPIGASDLAFVTVHNRGALGYDARNGNGFITFHPSSSAWGSQTLIYQWYENFNFADRAYSNRTIAATIPVSSSAGATVGKLYQDAVSRSYRGTWTSGVVAAPNGKVYIGNSGATYEVSSIRGYDRELSADEVKWNSNVDQVRFLGTNTASLTWPETMRIVDGKVSYAVSISCAEGEGTISVNDGGASCSTNLWLAYGDSVTVRAMPAAGKGFDGWSGTMPSAFNRRAETAVLTGAGVPYTLTATFHKALFVSTAGVDAADRGTAAAPYRTIQYAVNQAADNDWIHIAGGQYNESVSLPVFRNVSGSWKGDFSGRDLKNNRTLVKSTSTSNPCITIPKAAGTNVIYGLTLTGGSVGIQSRANGGANDSATYHHLFSQLIITNNTNGLDFDGGWNSVDLSSSLIADNSGYGFHHNADHGTKTYMRNCTFDSNGKAFLRKWIWAQAIETRNCTFIHNGFENYHDGARSYNVEEYDSSHHGNGVLFYQSSSLGGLGNGVSYFYYKLYNRHYNFDPKLDATTRVPKSGSPIQGLGRDMTSYGVYEDLYGTPWNGVYDLGCAKGPDQPSAKSAELWVATDGDDADTGTDAEHPLASINEAMARLAENGAIHLADGEYEEDVMISVPGAKIVGASTKNTVVRPQVDGTVQVGGQYKNWNFAIGIFAPDVVVSNLTVKSAFMGIFAQSAGETAGARATVAACNLRENVHGAMFLGAGPRNTLSHLQVRDNVYYGVYTYSPGAFDNLLVADNGLTGFLQSCNSGRTSSALVNSTIADNGGWGWYNSEGSPNTVRFLNTIFRGNASGAITQKSSAKAIACCFYTNGTDGVTHWGAGKNIDATSIYTDPKLDATATLRGHLAEASPCSQSGTNLTTYVWDISPSVLVTDDLDYVARLPAKMDMGCYDSPETINDLAGQGYHVVNIAATPNGYGEPDPMYGRHLKKDGPQTIDVSCTLTTDSIDGRRNVVLSEGVRARYVGYEVIDDEAGTTITSSDSAETYNFTLDRNLTFRIKWVVEDLLTVSSGKAGCNVSVNGCTPAEELHVWVTNNAPVTLTIIPSDDWAHSKWTGDVPSSVDPKEMTIIWTSDRPRTMEPTLRGVHYVCLTGSDSADGTKAHPWRTIGHAIAAPTTVAFDEVKVQGGLYEESVTNYSAKGGVANLVLTGSWNENWERDLKNARTVVTPPEAWKFKVPCLCMNTKSNTVHGFTFTGGSAGILANPNNSGVNESTVCHHEFVCLIVTNNVNGIDFSKSYEGVAMASSLIADNQGFGYYHFASMYSDRGARDYFYNCTFARNGAEGIKRGTRGTYATMKNCVFDGNGVGVRIYFSGYPVSVTTSCFGNSVTSAFMSVSIAADADSPMTFYKGSMMAPPLLDAAYAPTANSPFLGRGENLVQDAIFGFSTDVYGTLWDGTWDYGCIKSTFAARASVAEQHVAEDGDDRNDGLTAETPRRTLSAALAAVNDGGTIHVGPGRYEPVMVDRANVKFVGAGVGQSVIAMPDAVAARTAVVPAVTVLANSFLFEGFTLRNCHSGVHCSGNDYGKSYTLRCCEIKNCNLGVKAVMGTNRAGFHSTFDRCRVTDNFGTGFYMQESFYATSTLIARNGGYGIYINPWDTFDMSYAVNCTIISNKSHGIVGRDGGWTRGITVNNSIIAGHKIGVYRTDEHWSSGNYIYNTVLHNATNLWYVNDTSKAAGSQGGVYVDNVNSPNLEADPLLLTTPLNDGRPRTSSPSIGYGKLRGDVTLRPVLDLDGRPFNYTRKGYLDCGCYTRKPTPLSIILR